MRALRDVFVRQIKPLTTSATSLTTPTTSLINPNMPNTASTLNFSTSKLVPLPSSNSHPSSISSTPSSPSRRHLSTTPSSIPTFTSQPRFLSTTPTSPPRRHLSTTSALSNTRSVKRFYESVSIASGGSNSYEILLDGKKLKTLLGNVLSLPNHSLAIAVATEWESQLEYVDRSCMHLTALCATACDNPNRKTKVDLAQDFLQYVESDTLCYRVEHPSEMVALQEKLWDPLLEWFCQTYNVSITATQSIVGPTVPEATVDKLTQHMISQRQESLYGFVFAVESLKSVILALAVVDGTIGVEEAVNLSRLEVDYQTKLWGSVEWHHDVEMYDLQARVAAAVLYVTLTSQTETKITKMAAR